LRMEAKTQTRRRVDHPGQHDAPNGTLPQTEFASSAGHENPGGSFGDMGGIGLNESPSDTLADMTSWEQFDSMVRRPQNSSSSSKFNISSTSTDIITVGHVRSSRLRRYVCYRGLWSSANGSLRLGVSCTDLL
jgi:hypothetical protein